MIILSWEYWQEGQITLLCALILIRSSRILIILFKLNENREFTNRDPKRTSGTVSACIMSDHYEFKYIFSLGRYVLEDTMSIERDL